MFTESNLRELLRFQASQPVLSVYLNTDPSQGNAEAYRLRLRGMLKKVDLPDDSRAIERYISTEYNWTGRSVALFSCAPARFFRAYALAVPIRSRIRVGSQPHVKPLADLLDSFGDYGVALVDKQGSRVFSFHLGELVEQEGLLGESVRHVKRGGASSVPGRRGGIAGRTHAAEEIVERNVKDSVQFALNFFSEKNVRRVLIGGTDEIIALFRSHLPKAWQTLIVGSFSISMTAGHDEVLDRAMKAGLDAQRQRDLRMVEALITGAAKKRGSVVGLEDTLEMVHHGRVQILVIREGFRAVGQRCLGCGYITSQDLRRCPYCSSLFEKIPDVVELAVQNVLRSGGDVDVLHDDQLTQRMGQIGAQLRYG